MFYKLWVDAEEGRNNYTPIDVHWAEVPGRDDKWKQETIKNTSELQWNQEFECEFIGSTLTLIAPSKLRTMTFKNPIHSRNGFDIFEEPKPNKMYCVIADTCLLYTSPSPRDRQKSRMPSSA